MSQQNKVIIELQNQLSAGLFMFAMISFHHPRFGFRTLAFCLEQASHRGFLVCFRTASAAVCPHSNYKLE